MFTLPRKSTEVDQGKQIYKKGDILRFLIIFFTCAEWIFLFFDLTKNRVGRARRTTY